MAVVGIGVDLVDVRRFDSIARRRGAPLGKRLFTERERASCEGRPRSAEHLAGRFAAKEAFLKALGTGYSNRIKWTDMEVVGIGEKISLEIRGQAQAISRRRKVKRMHLSITHTADQAAAVVVLES
ncbi:MAG TPA: holo-ACP synthase [Planctomycetota bacterium]|nr:holo-ACP synthase [Planctomycetota bacterium]